MQLINHSLGNKQIAEYTSSDLIIKNAEDGLNLLGEAYFQGFDGIILHSENIGSEFFDLSTGIAGEVLQKFSNYRMRLAIVVSPELAKSKSLQQFIMESNKVGHINFSETPEEALQKLTKN